MARLMDLGEAKKVLGTTVNLSRTQWLILVLVLAIPLLAVVSSVFGLRYEAQANQSQLSNNEQLFDELTQQNQQMNATLEEQAATIAKQKKDINALKSDNQDLSSSLSANEAELAEAEDKKSDKHDKKKNCDDDFNWWCY